MPADSGQKTSPSPTARSAVTNGSRSLPGVDGRSLVARRFRDVTGEIIGDLGGEGVISEAQRQLARQAASLSVTREVMDARIASGEPVDMEEFTRVGHLLVRTLTALGLKRHARDASPQGITRRLREVG